MVKFTSKVTGGDAKIMSIVSDVFEDCKDITGSDKCDAAANMGLCLKEHGEKKKILLGM